MGKKLRIFPVKISDKYPILLIEIELIKINKTLDRGVRMNSHKLPGRFLAAFLVICFSFLLCSTSAVATTFNIGLSITIPYFLSVTYSNGSYSETITTQDQVVNRMVPLEYLPCHDGQFESVVAFEIRSNADWQLTFTPFNIDESSYWTIHEDNHDFHNHAISVDSPLSELGCVLQGNPKTPVCWHLHVLSPDQSSADAIPSIQLNVAQQRP